MKEMKEGLPEFIKEYLLKAQECKFPVKILLQTPRKGEVVSVDMEDLDFELHEFATIHDCSHFNNGQYKEGDMDEFHQLYAYKFEKNMDIMSLFPSVETNVDALVQELKDKDAYEVVQRFD